MAPYIFNYLILLLIIHRSAGSTPEIPGIYSKECLIKTKADTFLYPLCYWNGNLFSESIGFTDWISEFNHLKSLQLDGGGGGSRTLSGYYNHRGLRESTEGLPNNRYINIRYS